MHFEFQSHEKPTSFSKPKSTANVNLMGRVNDSRDDKDQALVARVNAPLNVEFSNCVQNYNKQSLPDIVNLKEVEVECDGNRIPTVIDSGAQITVISSKFISEKLRENKGTIRLQGAFGEEVNADLIKLAISAVQSNGVTLYPTEIIAAVTDKLALPCLMPPEVYELLSKQEPYPRLATLHKQILSVSEKQVTAIDEGNEEEVDSQTGVNNQIEYGESKDVGEMCSRDKLLKEQTNCETLKKAWIDVKSQKNGYCLVDGLLFHKDKIVGEPVTQLVLPVSKRTQVLQLAHESIFGAHLGFKKTNERIRYSFYWPTMKVDIKKYVETCEACQLKSRALITDRVPITPVARPNLPFQTVNLDIIGPIEPSSGRGHKYILCLICQHSRWPEAVPLRSLSAKATCDALLEIFCRTGIPEVIATDRGSNFTAALTTEFLKRLGSSPRLSVPGHPSSNGLVERWNSVLKRMIHHTIREDPRGWDRQIPYLLWAYREVPNATTGVSPFKLLYGREPVGPLSILKKSWAGEIPLPCNIGESAGKYLQELKERLEIAAEQAALTAEGKQREYAKYFNVRARAKSFKPGDQVILLIPDSTNKLYSRWTGPGEVIEYIPPHGYKVRIGDDCVRYVHANKIREFKVRTQAIGVIFESEEEFGDVSYAPTDRKFQSDPISMLNDSKTLDHLNSKQRSELNEVLRKHNKLFSGEIGEALTEKHVIRLKPGAERKKPYIYRIPEAVKSKVDDEINELLRLGLIEPCQAELAHPIICVSKKDGSIRLCTDLRSVNEVTVGCPFPMENATDLLREVGQKKYITVIDCLKGFWNIPLEESSRELTSFVTHRGQFRWRVMPFGLKNASATFQRIMNRALSQYRDFSRAYIDDIAVFSDTWEEHLEHLDMVLSRLEELQIAVNLVKCDFAKGTVKFLGHIVGSGTHAPDPDKIETIKGLKRPVTKKELRSLLGLCNYYREYIPNYAEVACPLTELTKRRVPTEIPWGEGQENSFQILKSKLCEAPTLFTPRIGRPYILHTDASSIAVGACLSQQGEDGTIHPISFASHKLTDTQKNWAAVEREAFAVVWALKKFETWLFGSTIKIVTDHNPLTFLTKCAPQSSRLQRWVFALQRYDLEVVHCPGSQLKNADGLSRLVNANWDNERDV